MSDADDRDIVEAPFKVEVDDIEIRGFRYARSSAGKERTPVLVILHGIPRAKPAPGDQSYRDMAKRFAKKGFMAFIFNFRGTGISDGDIGMAGWTRDLEAVINYAVELPEADPERIALLGFSAGGAVAIHVAAHNPAVSAVVSGSSPARFTFLKKTMPLEGWVTLFREIGMIRSPDFPPSIEEWAKEFDDIEPLKWVDKISPRPVLIMHGEEDELIPADQAGELYKKTGRPKDLILVKGGKHRLRIDPRALDLAEEWLLKWKDSKA
jgi:dipeptidyl aminopeptidase/acylaminoacyl peptidase